MSGEITSDVMRQITRLHHYSKLASMQDDVVRKIDALANDCIQKHGSFHIVLTGGRTPQPVYLELRHINTDWQAWHVYLGDERCLPEGDAERNDSMALQAWLSHVAIPPEQLHLIPAHLGAEAGAESYAKVVADVESFDLVLLGLGEDGHIASLFPGHTHDAKATVVPVHHSPKPPLDRISLSAGTLGRGQHIWFLVSGEGKRQALNRWQQGDDIPASTICSTAGVDIFTDIDIGE